MGRWIVMALLLAGCGASVGSGGIGAGMGEGVPAEPGATCSQRPSTPTCSEHQELCNVVSELDGCAYPECVPDGQCTGG